MMDLLSERLFTITVPFAAILIRWLVSTGSYSGMHKPPMYGDYEAQRHWQEITVNLPTSDWYRNTTDNDLMYWGLDYPPLTAYHSWACGKVARILDPDWVELHQSRGKEGYYHKLFMRYTVLLIDILLFFPAIYLVFIEKNRSQYSRRVALLVALFYPGIILIDYGHFQYNNMSLGLFIFAVYFLQCNQQILGAILFCLSLNYKQMELYHSIPFFCFLLGRSMQHGIISGFFNVSKLGLTVIATFALCWLPFLTSVQSVETVLGRLFPVGRGLYEDKVANVWCSISPVLKIKELVPANQAIYICIISTLLSCLPSSIQLLRNPTMKAFNFSCVIVSLAFFLFSFQVHEKSILIPAVSALLIYNNAPFLVSWFLHISVFSMTPLFMKDGLMLQYFVTRYMFMLITYVGNKDSLKPSSSMIKTARFLSCNIVSSSMVSAILQFKMFFSTVLADLLTLCLMFVEPPGRFPDLWPVCISMFSCLHFSGCLVFFTCMQLVCNSTTTKMKKIS
uniref:dolichyl pyrophosphate Man9GlcNAc2 alpha-1,3-glucosyltransferase-like n=1 Tax=Styela clava TaxID=7725 RepID=UPI0019397103|nr:dolichyl pyrophosphate Man9GlcNAc2 alpha-1,3-glucosyltransferase-like [Styela clava]